MSGSLPECGFYRTALPLPGKEQAVPAQRLVYFHNHSEQELPIVLLPAGVQQNVWSFDKRGYLVQDESWCATMIPLKKQGLYTVTSDLHLPGGAKLPAGLLVHLSYTQAGEAVAFPGTLDPGRAIAFAQRGLQLTDLQLDSLESASFKLLSSQAPTPGETQH